MPDHFNIGVIGAGMWGAAHIETLQKEERAAVTWACAATERTIREIQSKYALPHVTRDYTDVLADPQVDAVVIATPPFLHAEMLVAALEAGKHALLEKPMAANRRDMEQIVAAVQQHPKQVVLEASYRHARTQPKFRFLKEMIRRGQLGEVYHLRHVRLQQTTFIEYNPRGAWAQDRRLAGGGPFVDIGVYDLSFHLGLLDDVPQLRSLRAFTRGDLRDMSSLVAFSDVEQHGAAWLEFDNGLTYYYEQGAGVHGADSGTSEIFGTCGGVLLAYPGKGAQVNEVEFFSSNQSPHHETMTVDTTGWSGDDNAVLDGHFLDCLQGLSEPLMPVSLAAKHLDILFRILDSTAGK